MTWHGCLTSYAGDHPVVEDPHVWSSMGHHHHDLQLCLGVLHTPLLPANLLQAGH